MTESEKEINDMRNITPEKLEQFKMKQTSYMDFIEDEYNKVIDELIQFLEMDSSVVKDERKKRYIKRRAEHWQSRMNELLGMTDKNLRVRIQLNEGRLEFRTITAGELEDGK